MAQELTPSFEERRAEIHAAAVLLLHVVRHATSPEDLAARCLAATNSPLHTFDLMALAARIDNAACAFGDLLGEAAQEGAR